MLGLVARHLRNLGFSVLEASEGDAAWELAQQHVPDLVILDVMMPGMSGWEVCKRLKGDTSDGRPFASTGVIMLTGIGENLNEMTSPLFAADAWLNKPFDFGELDERIRETLERYKKGLPGSERAQAANGAATAGTRAGRSVKKTAAKKPAATKPAARSAPAKKPVAKKAAVKKGVAKKAAPKSPAAKKTAAKKPAPKAAAKKPASKAAAKKKTAAKRA